MNELIEQIAEMAADDAVTRYGQTLGKGKQLALWQRYYDSCLAGLLAYEDIQRAQRIRARATVSEN